jgi:hypothetical protein
VRVWRSWFWASRVWARIRSADPDHHREGADVLDVREHEGIARFDEKEIQGQDAQDGGDQGRPAAELGGRRGDAQHVEHDHIGQAQVMEHQKADSGGQRHEADGDAQVAQVQGFRRLGRQRGRRGGGLGGDHVDDQFKIPLGQVFQQRTGQPGAPVGFTPAHHQMGDLMGLGQGQQFPGHTPAREMEADQVGPQFLGQTQVVRQAALLHPGGQKGPGPVQVHPDPGRPARFGHPAGGADQPIASRPAVHRDHEPRRPNVAGHSPRVRFQFGFGRMDQRDGGQGFFPFRTIRIVASFQCRPIDMDEALPDHAK